MPFDEEEHGSTSNLFEMRTRLRCLSCLPLRCSSYLWNCWKRRFHLATVKRWLLVVSLVTVLFVIYCSYRTPYSSPLYRYMHTKPEVNFKCPTLSFDGKSRFQWRDHTSISTNLFKIEAKVLVFVDTTYSRLGRDIAELLVHNRMKYKVEPTLKTLPPLLTNRDKGKYAAIVFENYYSYLHMNKWNKELLDKYCREFDIGILGFLPSSEESLLGAQLKNTSLFVDTNTKVKDGYLNPNSEILRMTRPGDIVRGQLPSHSDNVWTVFYSNHSTFEPLLMATPYVTNTNNDDLSTSNSALTIAIQDKGEIDGVRRVLFGGGLKLWLNKLLFLDSLSYLSRGRLSITLKRYILVDIDDIFVGEKGTRLRREDVEAIIETQQKLRHMVPGFKFNLGFSGKYFHAGTDEENAGDDFLLENASKFRWFPHFWGHIQPHVYKNITQLGLDMEKNKDFAKANKIPTDSGYAVSPHHSGVYPVHEPLYDNWKKVWNIRVTSTEEYLHLRPARLRKGFIHRGIMVIPRQTCGLFTHTIFIDKYPSGQIKLEDSIRGGELFQTLTFNVVNNFMTHMSNYGNDRLGLYTFESVVKFLQCWTNIQMISLPPIQLAEKYFKLYPEEREPTWSNPCDDIRHIKIWSQNKSCESFPEFLVIGPQKTGTTALYTFLTMHPSISTSKTSPETFEEVQFFNGKNYFRGLDWYMKFFVSPDSNITTTNAPHNNSSKETPKSQVLFEKSANYFDNELVPKRAHALLPRAKIVTILISPAKRAYSWYQHMRTHGDNAALNYTFYEILMANANSPKPLKDLRNRCLNPGRYALHLERWLSYYTANQIIILDGDKLRNNPVTVMNRLQKFLLIEPYINYASKIRYDPSKGFYCQIVSKDKNKCLGKGKGRHYPQMDNKSAKYLSDYYHHHNIALVKLLNKLDLEVPLWLRNDLSNSL